MGCSFKNWNHCHTNTFVTAVPNPDPSRWICLDIKEYKNAYVLKVRYLDCTNFEGVKVMVYKGKYKARGLLDPHFDASNESPIARFKPTEEGWEMANTVAECI